MKVPWVTQNIGIYRAIIVTRRGTLDLSVGFERRNNQMLMSLNWLKEMSGGFERRNNQMLMSLNWLKEMKNNAIFYLLQTYQLVIKIDGS